MQLEILHHQPEQRLSDIPILFVHGAWHGAWCWDEYFLPYFAQHGYDAYALSLRGHAGSAGRWRWASVHDYVADVAQVAEQLDTPPIVIGHSMGGYIVQKYLEKYPVPGAVLVASVPTIGTLPFFLRLAFKRPAAMIRNLVTLCGHFWHEPKHAREAFFSESVSEDDLNRYFGKLQGESLWLAVESMGFTLPKPDRVSRDIPMLVVSARQDAVFTIDEQRKIAQGYGTEAHFFDMAHDMMLEPDWQDVADFILKWLQNVA